MAFLRKYKKRMLLTGVEVELGQGLEQGRRKKGTYSFPVDGDALRRIKSQVERLRIDDELMEEFREISALQQTALDIASHTDWPGDEKLFNYQRVAVAWLAVVKRGILADEMGLGKTVEALWTAEQTDFTHGVIVCTNAKKKDWKDEAEKWTTREVFILTGDAQKREMIFDEWWGAGGWIICNYKVATMHDHDLEKSCDLLIADEAHAIRNRKTRSFNALKDIADHATWVYLLTGSPVINLTGDTYALLRLVDPNRFGSYWFFIFRLCKVTQGWGGAYVVHGVKESEKENLDRILSAYMLGRPRSVKEDLPDQHARVVDYELDGLHEELYREFEETGVLEFDSGEVSVDVKIASITRLRQLAISPRLLDPDYRGPDKFDVLIELAKETQNKIVAFSMFAEAVELAVHRLIQAGIFAVPFHGSMNDKQRQEQLDKFQKGKAQVLVATMKTAGEGLNLVEADRVIMIDYPWNPAGVKQAESRINRPGQDAKDIYTIFIHAPGTIDDHIKSILDRKEKVTVDRLIREMRSV